MFKKRFFCQYKLPPPPSKFGLFCVIFIWPDVTGWICQKIYTSFFSGGHIPSLNIRRLQIYLFYKFNPAIVKRHIISSQNAKRWTSLYTWITVRKKKFDTACTVTKLLWQALLYPATYNKENLHPLSYGPCYSGADGAMEYSSMLVQTLFYFLVRGMARGGGVTFLQESSQTWLFML